jgi:hypothetical protein
MITKKTILLTALVFSIIIFPLPVLADGMFISPRGSFMYEPGQQAIIQYDSTTNQEELTIMPFYEGDAPGFAWVVPVPSQPEVTLADDQMFWDLDSITQPVTQSRDGSWGCFRENYYDVYDGVALPSVQIISEDLVGYYQTLVVSATETSALMDSLTTWGFLHDENGTAVFEALEHYVDMGWYFVAMKVDADDLAKTTTSEPAPIYYYGYGLEPVTFSFLSDDMVYPMRISSVSAYSSTVVNLFIIAEHRMQFPGAQTLYANRFSSGEISELAHLPALAGLLEPGIFMTKLQRRYTPSQMSEDIVFTTAANDNEFVMIYYSGLPLTGLLLFGPAAVWAFIRRRKLLGQVT